jgi:hypothetical protein
MQKTLRGALKQRVAVFCLSANGSGTNTDERRCTQNELQLSDSSSNNCEAAAQNASQTGLHILGVLSSTQLHAIASCYS